MTKVRDSNASLAKLIFFVAHLVTHARGRFITCNTSLFKNAQDKFRIIFLGGDEVKFDCWSNSSEIQDYFVENGIDGDEEDYFALWIGFLVS